jgi:TolB-like protein/Tfp pilus assembly protein PilF
MTERPTRPRTLRDTVPEAVDDAVMKALARLPGDRFESVGEFATAMEQAIDSQPVDVSAGRHLASRRWLWPVVVAGALMVVLILQRAVFPSNDSAGEAAVAEGLLRDRPSVAVLPFDNLSPSAEDAYLADGIHEEILTRLSKISGLIVISRSSVLRYRDHGLTGAQIAAELSVSALLEGSVQKAGNQIKITAQLIDGETDAHLWGESYDRDFSIESLFDVQSEVAFRIAENLRATLTPLEENRITNAPTENLRAYELYLRGRRAYDLYQSGENASAIELYRRAIGLDPSFAAAWAALGDAYAQGILLFGVESTWWDSALAVSQRAISLDVDRADGYKALGLVHMSRGSYRPALEALLQALEIEPNHPTAAANVGVVLMRFGSLDESLLWNRRALSVAPNHMLIRANMAWSYLALGELDVARQWARETVALEQGMAHAHWALSAVAAARSDHARALEIAERVIEIDPDSPARRQFAAEIALFARDLATAGQHSIDALDMNLGGSIPPWHFPGTTLGYVLWQRGEIESAGEQLQGTLAAVEQLIVSGADDPRLPWEIGCIHAIQGAVDEALVWLDRGFREGWRWTIEVEADPLLDTVRDSPRFVRLVSAMAADVETMRRQALQLGTNAHLR